MKSIKFLLTLITIVMSLATCIDNDPPAVPDLDEDPPQPTPIGFPIDIPSMKTIGASGGTISSLDERISLDIPAGALNGDTDITIQPITNFAPNGNGNAYQLSPEGIKFNKPLKITFKHGKEISSTAPPLTGIAFQDAEGFWHSSGNFTWDATNKTVSTETMHFSGWATFDDLKIIAKSAIPISTDKFGNPVYKLKVEDSGDFELVAVTSSIAAADGSDLSPLGPTPNGVLDHVITYQRDSNLGIIVKQWSVNGDVNGSTGIYGTINVSGQDSLCTYKAPPTKPSTSKNPVQLSVKLRNLKYKDQLSGKVFNDLMVSTQVKIVDDIKFELYMTYKTTNSLTGGLIGKAFEEYDTASMKVVIRNGLVTCSDTVNHKGDVIPASLTDLVGCTSTSIPPEGFKGPLDITSADGIFWEEALGQKLRLNIHGTRQSPAFNWNCPSAHLQIPAETGVFFYVANFNISDDGTITTLQDPGETIFVKLTQVD